LAKPNHVNWANREPDKAAKWMAGKVEHCEQQSTWRHSMAARGAAAYQGLSTGDLFHGLSPFDRPKTKRAKAGGWGTRQRWNYARAISETFCEKLTGLDEPKTQMVATDAEWEIRRQGIWADRFIEGGMHEAQGQFLDGWDLVRHGFLLAAVSTGTVAARVEEDYVSKRVTMALRSTLSTFIDPGDVAAGRPLTFIDVTWENPEYLVCDPRFKAHKDWIMESAVVPPFHRGVSDNGPFFDTPMVKMVSAWRMPFGGEKGFKGRDARFVGGKAIHWEKWEDPTPPLAFFGMTRCIGDSFWCENFIEIMMGALEQADDIAVTAERVMKLTSQRWLVIDKKATDINDVQNAKDVSIVSYDSTRGAKPEVKDIGILHADYFNWLDRNIDTAMKLAGIPDMHVSAQSPAGTDSGRAKRLEASLLPERHAKKQRNWRHWSAVDIAKLFVRAARRIGEVEPKWQVTWPGQDFDAKVEVGVLDIDTTQYVMRPYAVSEQKNTPADRAQAAQEMLDRGEITTDQFNLIVQGAYDVPRESRGPAVMRRYVSMALDDILHCEESVIADENEYMSSRYMPPLPFWSGPAIATATAQAQEIYSQAMIDKVPQNRRNIMRRFLEELDAMTLKEQQAETVAQNTNISVDATLGQVAPQLAPDAGAVPGAAPPPPGAMNGQALPGIPAPGGTPPLNTGAAPGIA
jgi:hypothetical protein